MVAENITIVSPFGAIMGDTYPIPSVSLLDSEGAVIDIASYTISLDRWAETGEESNMPGTIDANVVTFPWLVDDTIAHALWQTMVSIDDTEHQYSLSAPALYVYDLSLHLCTVADVVAIVGDGYSQYEILRAIEVASAAVTAWVVLPIGGPPVPLAVRRATALLAARAVTAVPGTPASDALISSERIGDYEVRYSLEDGTTTWGVITNDIEDLLRPWRPNTYSSNIAENRAPTDDALDDEGYLPL